MAYAFWISDELHKKLLKLKKKDLVAFNRIFGKISEIQEIPERGKPLRNRDSGVWEVHVGHFVLTYTIDENNRVVKLQDYEHKDRAYTR